MANGLETLAGSKYSAGVVFDLVLKSSLPCAVLFDPEQFRGFPDGEEFPSPESDLLAIAAARGDLFAYLWHDTDAYKFTVYVDEQPDQRLIDRALADVKDLLLRVPSGRLALAASDGVSGKFEGEPAYGDIAPGNYKLSAWIVGPSDEEIAGTGATAFDCLSLAGSIATAVLLFALIVAIGAKLWIIAACIVGVLVLYWSVYLSWYNFSGKRQEEEAKHDRELREGSPSIVVSLVAVDRIEDGWSGGTIADP